jgi:N-acetyl-1-D-myo-inositol-2-amino-2-deoxy-alpha-D-glucopyranoside deacetylase
MSAVDPVGGLDSGNRPAPSSAPGPGSAPASGTVPAPGQRYLFLHAHPDDETLSSGAIIVALRARGDTCLVLTATRGELGEAQAGSLTPGANLVAVRQAERARALASLGAEDAGWLGQAPNRATGLGDRVYQDSGMVWLSPGRAGPGGQSGPAALARADPAEVVADLVAAARQHRAQALVSYDATGGYGHPDHVCCHQVARAAAAGLGLPFFQIVDRAEPGVWWLDATGQSAVVAAHRAYATQFSLDGLRLVHVGGQPDQVRQAGGLRVAGPDGTATMGP